MHVTGIIAEYNPFHNGHAHMIKEIRKKHPDTLILAVMSGGFTQRGSIAVMDKWSRARMALGGGCDLVLELPFAFAVRSAQEFARGAVLLMDRLGTVDELAFGTECSEPEKLQHAAKLVDAPCVQEGLHASIRAGSSYARALALELSRRCGLTEAELKEPNTILAVEYLRSLHLAKSGIRPFPINRWGAGHHDPVFRGHTASASGIRRELLCPSPRWPSLSRVLPETSLAPLKSCDGFPRPEGLYTPLLASLLAKNLEDLKEIHGVNEGLEHRIFDALPASRSLRELTCAIASKRYPKSRIRRLMAHVLADFRREDSALFDQTGPRYGRVLAFNERGRLLLRRIKQQGSLPIVTRASSVLNRRELYRPSQELSPLQRMLRFDCRSTDLQGLCLACPAPVGRDFFTSPLYLSESTQ